MTLILFNFRLPLSFLLETKLKEMKGIQLTFQYTKIVTELKFTFYKSSEGQGGIAFWLTLIESW